MLSERRSAVLERRAAVAGEMESSDHGHVSLAQDHLLCLVDAELSWIDRTTRRLQREMRSTRPTVPAVPLTWPVIAGSYEVGDPQGPVAICTLTTESLIAPLVRLPGVAIAGKVYTANLGITRIVQNVTANPAIRFLLLCGKDSPLFHPGQSLAALAERGVDADRRIVGAIGYEPVLSTLDPARIAQFRRQVEVVDWAGEEDLPGARRGHWWPAGPESRALRRRRWLS